MLAEAYKAITEAGHAFEIVFVSADESEKEALSYFESMPWKMLVFDQRKLLNNTLSEKLGIRGIPCLVLLGKDGKVITNKGREVLLSTDFENIASFAAEKKAREEKVQQLIASLLKSKELIGLYFATSWSPASRNFTPALIEKYNSFLADNKSFEVIFVSWDREPGAGVEYFAEMPWTMLDDSDDKIPKLVFEEVFRLVSLPMLVLLNTKEILTEEGEEAIHTSDSFEELLSYPEREKAVKEKELAEFPSLPDSIMIEDHDHLLVKQQFVCNGRYVCYICRKGGTGSAYHCFECGFDGHINCTLNAPKATQVEDFFSC